MGRRPDNYNILSLLAQPQTTLSRLFPCFKPYDPMSNPNIPSLLSLPLEILLQIIDHLTEVPELSLAILRRTHRVFYHIIPNTAVRDKPSKTRIGQHLHTAQEWFPYLFPQDHYACFICLTVKPAPSFADRGRAQRTVRGAKVGPHCLDCEIRCGRYRSGGPVVIRGVDHWFCHECRRVYSEAQCRVGRFPDSPHSSAHVCGPNYGPRGVLCISAVALIMHFTLRGVRRGWDLA